MATGTSLSSRRGLGGFAAMIGGALMAVSVWTPWLDTQTDDPTGWDIYTTLSDSGRNLFYEHNFFDPGFSPFFSGLTMLIAGGLLALIGLALLASVRGGAFSLPGAAVAVLDVLALLIFVAAAVNLFSLFTTGPGTGILDPAYGLYLLAGGGLVGFIGVLSASLRSPSP
ncbi:MAG: hypothetical protein KJ698_01275 [Actinobacteria bacterium]|nr:hypothetical protein [Actinomycetota bacterium]MBU1493577.1 hypothetical protein [Actinomycetota bacterium]